MSTWLPELMYVVRWVQFLDKSIEVGYKLSIFDNESIMNKYDKPTKSHLNELHSYHYRCDLNIDPGKNNIVLFTIYTSLLIFDSIFVRLMLSSWITICQLALP